MIPYAIRFGKPEDLPYVTDTWVKRDERLKGQRMVEATKHVRGILATPGTFLRVAHLLDDIDAILGYAVFGADALHFVYVRKPARGRGISRALRQRPDALA